MKELHHSQSYLLPIKQALFLFQLLRTVIITQTKKEAKLSIPRQFLQIIQECNSFTMEEITREKDKAKKAFTT